MIDLYDFQKGERVRSYRGEGRVVYVSRRRDCILYSIHYQGGTHHFRGDYVGTGWRKRKQPVQLQLLLSTGT